MKLLSSNKGPVAALMGVLIAISAPVGVAARPQSEVSGAIAGRADELRAFYAARDFKPLWMRPDGTPRPAIGTLLDHLDTAQLDGISGKNLAGLKTKSLRRVLRKAASGDADDVAKAELSVSAHFVRYVRAMRSAPRTDMVVQRASFNPGVPSAANALQDAGKAGSLEDYIQSMGWMHPYYAPLRNALGARTYAEHQRRQIWQNLERIRALPPASSGRYVLVDTASAHLWMFENGKAVDSMRVVVGKPDNQTPMMVSYMGDAILNPYWNIPPDLVQKNIAPNVLDQGIGYLRDRGYEVLSDYSDRPAVLDPRTINWSQVAAGSRFVRVRQKPGGQNFMGKVKYEMPNELGIYLHDTPDRHLLREDMRQLSSGCIRLEDPDRFGEWLLGKRLPKVNRQVEQRVGLPDVPIYITYLTVMPENGRIAFRGDVYGRDSHNRLASAN